MPDRARRTVLPSLALSTATDVPNEFSEKVCLRGKSGEITYFRTPVRPASGKRLDGGPEWALGRYSRFPVVLNADGSPWAEAVLYLIDIAELKTEPNMLSLGSVAEDLAAFKTFIHEEDLDWLSFGPRKFTRPTYRYSAALKALIRNGGISPGVAKRRMSVVVRFYSWLIKNGLLVAENSPWVEHGVSIVFKDDTGASQVKSVTSTDVSIRVSKSVDPFDERLDDGGKLRPLPAKEQHAVLAALRELENTEVTLIHHFALLTGAREQTVLTLRVHQFATPPDQIRGEDVRLLCGPGTGIDTKKNKRGILHIPKYLYAGLHVYSVSERARARRAKSDQKDDPAQYLFLTQHGKPFYESIEDRHRLRLTGQPVKSTKQGQSLRAFIAKRVIPLAQIKLADPSFRYQFHDLRASYGMNFIDYWIGKAGPDPAKHREKILKQLSTLMWHSNVSTTLGYLQYRENLRVFEAADESWHAYLQGLVAGSGT